MSPFCANQGGTCKNRGKSLKLGLIIAFFNGSLKGVDIGMWARSMLNLYAVIVFSFFYCTFCWCYSYFDSYTLDTDVHFGPCQLVNRHYKLKPIASRGFGTLGSKRESNTVLPKYYRCSRILSFTLGYASIVYETYSNSFIGNKAR